MKKQWKIVWIIVCTAVYAVMCAHSNSNFMLLAINIANISGIMLYSYNVLIAVQLFTLSEIFSLMLYATIKHDINQAIYSNGINILIYIIGLLIWVIICRKQFKKDTDLKHRISNLRNIKVIPKKLSMISEVTLYCILLIATSVMINLMNIGKMSILTGFWAVIPIFTCVIAVCSVSAFYEFQLLYQLVLAIIAYMEFEIGRGSITNTLSIVVMSITIIISYIDYYRLLDKSNGVTN